MNNRLVFDSVFDALLKEAAIRSLDDEIEAIEAQIKKSAPFVFSERHVNRIKRLFSLERRKEMLASFARVSRRVAVAILITATILFGAFMTVPEVRAAVVETIIEWFDGFARFISPNSAPTEGVKWELSYIPEGYSFDEHSDDEMIIYMNDEGETLFFYWVPVSSQVNVNSDESTYSIKTFNGVEYHCFISNVSDRPSSVNWTLNDGYRYILVGLLSEDELMKVAFSVE